MKYELKPCPFCGGLAEREMLGTIDAYSDYMVIACQVCPAKICESDEKSSVHAWNRRVPAAQPAQKQGE